MCEIKDLIQGSQEWLDFRLNKIGASQVGAICGVNPFENAFSVYQAIRGLQTQYENHHMIRGRNLESTARSLFEDLCMDLFPPAVYQDDDHPWAIASLDGICIEKGEILEIKCPSSESSYFHEIPIWHRYQMQWQMRISGIHYCNYFVYISDEKNINHEVLYDPILSDKIFTMCKAFYDNHVVPGIPPPYKNNDAKKIEDKKFFIAENERSLAIQQIKFWESEKKKYEDILYEFYDNEPIRGNHILIKECSRKGSLNEEQMIADGIDVDSYRNKISTFKKIINIKD